MKSLQNNLDQNAQQKPLIQSDVEEKEKKNTQMSMITIKDAVKRQCLLDYDALDRPSVYNDDDVLCAKPLEPFDL